MNQCPMNRMNTRLVKVDIPHFGVVYDGVTGIIFVEKLQVEIAGGKKGKIFTIHERHAQKIFIVL